MKITSKRVLLVLILLQVLVNVVWQFVNNSPPSWDAANHSTIAIQIAHSLRNLQISELLSISNYYPTFVHSVAAVLILVFGPSIKLIQLTGTVFLIAAISGLYMYAHALTRSSRMALITVTIFSFCPIIFDQSRRMMLDIPLTAAVIYCWYFLLKSNYLSRRKYIYLFSVSVGILLLTKWTGVLFLVVPSIETAIHIFREKRVSRNLIIDMIIGTAIILFLITPWYVTNAKNLAFLSSLNVSGESSDPTSLLSVVNLFYYVKMITNYLTTPLIAGVFLLSSLFLVFTHQKHRFSLLGTILFTYLVFTFVGNKDPRYIMPLVPLISLCIAIFLENLITRSRQLGILFASSVLSLSFLSFFILTVRPAVTEGMISSVYIPGVSWVNIIDINDSVTRRYQLNLWPDSLVVREISTNSGSAVVAYETEYFNPSTLQMYLVAHQYNTNSANNFVITPDVATLTALYNQISFPDMQSVSQYLSQSRYLVVGRTGTGVEYARNKVALEQIRTYIDQRVGCEKYQILISPQSVNCIVPSGTTLKTSSDILVNGVKLSKGEKTLTGPQSITCPYGCSFQIITKDALYTHFQLVNTVTLPSGELIDIYERVF